MTNLIRNERLKFTANWLNAIATAVVGAGVVGPIAYVLLDLGTKPINLVYTTSIVLYCAVVSVGLHTVGRALLGELKNDE